MHAENVRRICAIRIIPEPPHDSGEDRMTRENDGFPPCQPRLLTGAKVKARKQKCCRGNNVFINALGKIQTLRHQSGQRATAAPPLPPFLHHYDYLSFSSEGENTSCVPNHTLCVIYSRARTVRHRWCSARLCVVVSQDVTAMFALLRILFLCDFFSDELQMDD